MHLYGIENKIFKTVADHAANMKKALSEVNVNRHKYKAAQTKTIK
jgi:hypothetical protein